MQFMCQYPLNLNTVHAKLIKNASFLNAWRKTYSIVPIVTSSWHCTHYGWNCTFTDLFRNIIHFIWWFGKVCVKKAKFLLPSYHDFMHLYNMWQAWEYANNKAGLVLPTWFRDSALYFINNTHSVPNYHMICWQYL